MTQTPSWLKRIFAIAILLFTLFGCASSATKNETDAAFTANQLAIMELEFDAFDQDLDGGWRAWGQRGEHTEAARMLDHYASTHDELNEFQRRIIRFHAGQMYGYAGNDKTAVERFRESIDPGEPADSPFKWNAYVEGTIAFLERDMDTLQRMRAILDTQPVRERPMPDGTIMRMKPNLHVLDSFIENFDSSYRDAYGRPPKDGED